MLELGTTAGCRGHPQPRANMIRKFSLPGSLDSHEECLNPSLREADFILLLSAYRYYCLFVYCEPEGMNPSVVVNVKKLNPFKGWFLTLLKTQSGDQG